MFVPVNKCCTRLRGSAAFDPDRLVASYHKEGVYHFRATVRVVASYQSQLKERLYLPFRLDRTLTTRKEAEAAIWDTIVDLLWEEPGVY